MSSKQRLPKEGEKFLSLAPFGTRWAQWVRDKLESERSGRQEANMKMVTVTRKQK